MRKRELLIIAAFAVMGVVAYQLTAAPAPDGRRRFSLANFMDELRRETDGRRAVATVTTEGTVDVATEVTEARVSNISHVTIRGEARDDIAYTLQVESGGPNQEAARENAGRARLSEDRLGPILSLGARFPPGGRHVATLTLIVPARLRLRVEAAPGSGSLEARHVSDLELDGLGGDVRIADVAGLVSGTHHNGDLSVSAADRVDLSLQNSEAVLDGIRTHLRLASRNGRSQINDARGPVEVTTQNDETVVRRPAAALRVTGMNGSLAIEDPAGEVHVDVRRATVRVLLRRATPATILAADAPLHLDIAGDPAIVVDAVATDGGTITAEPFDVLPETRELDARLRLALAEGGVPVALRNRRAPIVIGRAK
jgi:hypothetical protein